MIEPNQDHPLLNVIFVFRRSMASLFVRWRLSKPRIRMIASYLQADDRTITQGLRLYDATDHTSPESIRDFVMTEQAVSCSIEEIEAGRIYVVDYGLFHQGQFYPILRSEPVALVN